MRWPTLIRVSGIKRVQYAESVSISRMVWIADRENGRDRRNTLFQKLEVARFGFRRTGSFLHEFQELTQAVPLGGAMPSKRTRTPLAFPVRATTPLSAKPLTQIFPLGTQRPISTFAPAFTGWPFRSNIRWRWCWKDCPRSGRGIVDTKLNRYETLDPRMTPPVATPVRAEQIGFERRRRRSGHWEGQDFLLGWLGRPRLP